MKHILLTAIIAILTISAAQAQKITKRDATSEDFIQLLKRTGYEVYSFNVEFEQGRYSCYPSVKILKNGKWEPENPIKLQVFPDDGNYHCKVGISPINDTTMQAHITIGENIATGNIGGSMAYKLVGKGLVKRPFVLPKKIKSGEFIPLVAVSAAWLLEDVGMYRNCDIDEFDSDYMNTTTFQKSPLIYVIGVTYTKIE